MARPSRKRTKRTNNSSGDNSNSHSHRKEITSFLFFLGVALALLNLSRVDLNINLQNIIDVRHAVEEPLTAKILPVLGHKKVLLTGGAGFIGSHVAEALLKRGDEVIIIDEMNDYYDVEIKEENLRYLQETYPTSQLTFFRGDICDETLLRHIFQLFQPQWVCHMAARAGVRSSIQNPFVYVHSNVEGTTRMLELSREFNVQNFVYASSASVYGVPDASVFKESQKANQPISPYAATKAATELLAHTYHAVYGMNVTGLRFFTVYGPRGRPDMAPYKFIDLISQGAQIEQYGDGSTTRDFTYIDDIVNGVVRAIDRPYPCEVFNLGGNDGVSLKDFIQLVEETVGKKANILVKPPQLGDVPFTHANVDKAAALLDYKPHVPVHVGVAKTVEWYRQYKHSIHAMQQEKKSICFVTAVFAPSVEQADEVPDIHRKSPKTITNSPDFKFYAFTNLKDLPTPGWEKILLDEELSKFPNDIVKSRYPKFMAWKIPIIRQNCKVAWYCDGALLPIAEGKVWKDLSEKVLKSGSGWAQIVNGLSLGPLEELKAIEKYKKARPEQVRNEMLWYKSQPIFNETATVYGNDRFGFDPSSVWFRQATSKLWDRYSINNGSVTFRDQPLWSYTLDRLLSRPMILDYTAAVEKYWKKVGKWGFDGHRYDK